MKKQKGQILLDLGLEPVSKLNKTICRRRARHLNKWIKEGEYDHDDTLLYYAKYYKNWYKWLGENGGTRASA